MIIVIKIFLLAALVKLALVSDSPLLCAGIYAGSGLALSLLFGAPLGAVVLAAIMGFALASAYFWLLYKFQGSGFLWWVIMVVGFAIGLV
jgi:hypothetical protein